MCIMDTKELKELSVSELRKERFVLATALTERFKEIALEEILEDKLITHLTKVLQYVDLLLEKKVSDKLLETWKTECVEDESATIMSDNDKEILVNYISQNLLPEEKIVPVIYKKKVEVDEDIEILERWMDEHFVTRQE